MRRIERKRDKQRRRFAIIALSDLGGLFFLALNTTTATENDDETKDDTFLGAQCFARSCPRSNLHMQFTPWIRYTCFSKVIENQKPHSKWFRHEKALEYINGIWFPIMGALVMRQRTVISSSASVNQVRQSHCLNADLFVTIISLSSYVLQSILGMWKLVSIIECHCHWWLCNDGLLWKW